MTIARLAPTLLVGGIAALSLFAFGSTQSPPTKAEAASQPFFANWPKNTKPDAVVVITGQTYGYLQPCGCSRPQLGGVERRAQFIAALKAKGWPVAGVDLGDILPVAGVVGEQVLLKYFTSMNALREMGYVAVGVGKAEMTNGLFAVLDQYAARKEQPPYTLAGNIGGVIGGKVAPRAETFFGPGSRPMVGLLEVAEIGSTSIGIASVVGLSVQKQIEALGGKTLVGFTPETDSLQAAVKELAAHPKKPMLNVLLYQGTLDEAKKTAKNWPQFRVIVCLSPDTAPPEVPETVEAMNGQKTLIVQVGHKGRYVGVLGAYKQADGGIDLKFELVPLGEAFVTPGDEASARKTNPILPLLDGYASQVKQQNLLAKFPETLPPPVQKDPKLNLNYVGSETCAKCHAAEHATWKETGHSHAFETLETMAKRPALRQFDGECLVCHTVGLGYRSGFRDEAKTPHLKDVGCESCHGPGSGHAADPKDPKYLTFQSPWKQQKTDRLPDLATMNALAKVPANDRARIRLKPSEQRMLASVSKACMTCHDSENDPHFDLPKYWPKVAHPVK
jgi:hypothetical protein